MMSLQCTETEAKEYRVIVLCRTGRSVSYPPTGFPLYTRQKAIDLLKRFKARGGDCTLDCWAEAPHCRFDLEWLETYPNWPSLE
jgi:hypothetical protein